MSALYVDGRTDVGRERELNEDALLIERIPGGGTLLVVCDGLGGHGGGDVASQLAARTLADVVQRESTEDPRRALYEGFIAADRAVSQDAASGGATAVAAYITGNQAWVAWAGDSRLLHLRDGRIVEATRDHTAVAELVARGELTPLQAEAHPERHVVTRALGSGDVQPDVWGEPVELLRGDALLLISDGVHDLVLPEEIPALLDGRDYREATALLVDLANERGGTDNITAALAVYESPQVNRDGEASRTARRATLETTTAPVAAPPEPAPAPEPVRPPAPAPRPEPANLRVVVAAVLVLIALMLGFLAGFATRSLLAGGAG